MNAIRAEIMKEVLEIRIVFQLINCYHCVCFPKPSKSETIMLTFVVYGHNMVFCTEEKTQIRPLSESYV
jgi:hypothetical protein